MAIRRMFSKKIVSSARFIKMPHESQALYFHLCLEADDDGVVEAYSVMRMTGTNEDNLRVLISKSFLKVLNEDLVSYILDWNEHNLLRADRKVDSIYKNLLLQILPETKLLKPSKRADTKRKTDSHRMDGQWTTNGRLSIGKDSIGKDRLVNLNIYSKPYSKLEDITKEDLEEIADKYNLPVPLVENSLDNLRNYCSAKGKTYKNYKAALINFVKSDALKFSKGGVRSEPRAIDLSQLGK